MKHDGAVRGAVLTKDETRILSWSEDHTLRLWDVATGQQIGPAMKHDGPVNGALLTKDERRILSWSEDETLRLWDVATAQQIGPAMKHDGPVNGALLTKDERRILSWSYDNTLRIWDADTGANINTLRQTARVESAAFSPNGMYMVVAVSKDKTVRVWSVKDLVSAGASLCVLCATVAFSADGTRLIAAGWAGEAQVWDVRTEKRIRVIQHGAAINVARLTLHGTKAITAGDDGAARVWDVSNGALLAVIRGHGDAITQAELTQDDAVLVTAARDGSVRVTSLAQAQWLNHVDLITGYRPYILSALASVSATVTNLNEDWRYLKTVSYRLRRIHALSAPAERALKPTDSFKECTDCPEMVVLPAGSFMMGSQNGHDTKEEPQHNVTVAKPFATSKFEVTFAEWDVCAAYGYCNSEIYDQGFGRGRQPVINISWDDARQYVAWLSAMTGKPYRLLTEAEYEYAMRAGTTTSFPWGNSIGLNNANCIGCTGASDSDRPSPVGSFRPNAFGLNDTAGNVAEWVEDCYHSSYDSAPTDSSAWVSGDCVQRVVRGGSWLASPEFLRSANRLGYLGAYRGEDVGFRVARTLLTP